MPGFHERKAPNRNAQEVIICGLMSCRGDAYNPAEALGVEEALEFHI
jgi:hypothetical protein